MSGETTKQSKSQRAGLRGLSVGKFQRWMCDAQLALCVHDQSAVYLTAIVENLLEEIVLQCMPCQGEMLTTENLEAALAHNVELWGLLQPYSHLICSRTANGEWFFSVSMASNKRPLHCPRASPAMRPWTNFAYFFSFNEVRKRNWSFCRRKKEMKLGVVWRWERACFMFLL